MTRTSLAVAMTLLVLAGGAAPLVSATTTTTPASEQAVQPGERLAGVVGVQGTDLKSDLERRVFGNRIAASESNASKASIVAEELDALRNRLDTLRDRKATLEAAFENESITRGEYAARMAHLVAEERAITQMLNVTAATAAELPSDVLAANGVNASAIEELRENAANLTGSEVAAIAQQIAGPPDNRTRGNDTDEHPGQSIPAISQAASAIATAEQQISAANDRVSEENTQLETAQEKLDDARDVLEEARDAASNGNTDEARQLANQAKQLAQDAAALARDASPTGGDEGADAETTTTTRTNQ